MGAILALALGVISLADIPVVWHIIWNATGTFVALIIISLLLDEAGFFAWAALHVARWGRGRGRRLFAYMVLLGALVSALFANDGAALILTPIVMSMLLALRFSPAATLAFVMGAGFIADTASLPGGVQPGEHRLGRLLQDWLQRIRRRDGAGKPYERCRDPRGIAVVFPTRYSANLRPGRPRRSRQCDPRPRDVPGRLVGAGHSAGGLLCPGTAGHSHQRHLRRLRHLATGDRRQGPQDFHPQGAEGSALADRDFLPGHAWWSTACATPG